MLCLSDFAMVGKDFIICVGGSGLEYKGKLKFSM